MESKKLKSFEDQLSKIKPFLPQYLIPRGAGSGRVPFPAQIPARLEGRFSSEQPGSV